jgi:hypothetical protein
VLGALDSVMTVALAHVVLRERLASAQNAGVLTTLVDVVALAAS